MTQRGKAWCAIPGLQLIPQLLRSTWLLFSVFPRILQALAIKAFRALEAHFAHLGCFLKGLESRHSQPCHLLASCMLHQQQCPILFHLPTPGLVPRTSLIFLANTFFVQDVLPVTTVLMHCLKVLLKSVLDNSQFVTQESCLSKGKTKSPWGSPLSHSFISPLTALSQAKAGLEKPRGSVPGAPNSYKPLHNLLPA